MAGKQSNTTGIRLVIGDKNVSSWSLRAWLALEVSGLQYEELFVRLDTPGTSKDLKAISPSGKVPCLIHGDLKIWDSLAICEYLAELAPDKRLWPVEQAKRAMARSYVSEMHSGFQALRTQLSMDIRLRLKIRHLTPSTISDIQRILFLWESALTENEGHFLFGPFGIADAFFAPVVFRFQSYGIEIASTQVQKYMKSILEYQPVQKWTQGALREEPYIQTF
ncbi:MAG: glutathione S-transferase family protein [Bdellovibrionales bacterium]|nr:glutathione S-transferase family protein [Bdellovibrionales bacterium]